MIMWLVALFVGAYLLGSIPFGLLITRAQGIDITKVGSGNIGATNVKRALGLKWALVVFALDFLKGFGTALLAHSLDNRQWLWLFVGFAAVIGHVLSPFMGFRGGKGVATSLGAVVASAPMIALIGFGVFVVVLAVTRYLSLASICGVATAPISAALLPRQSPVLIWSFVVLLCFVIYTHRMNIERLINGNENKFDLKKNRSEEAKSEDEP